MPWKESQIPMERAEFVRRLLNGERMSDLCGAYGISRKTGYKFKKRYERHGFNAFLDTSRRPNRSPNRTPPQIAKLIVVLREKHPTWGPRKLKVELGRRHEGLSIPAPSTIGEVLKRHGLIKPRRRRRRVAAAPMPLQAATKPNELWCADFKGQFRLRGGRYCYPLTITDHHTRFLLGCEALGSTELPGVLDGFELAFREYGLPDAIRTDNGTPFASQAVRGLSQLSVWWLRLGIRLQRIQPGRPEQNGRHERMHLTLKQEATRPPKANLLQQQEHFDGFRDGFNTERPHEALDMKRPADVYTPSLRVYPEALPEPDYALHDATRRVQTNGTVWPRRKSDGCYFISSVLAGQPVGLREVDEQLWLVSFMDLDLGHIDERTSQFHPLEEARQDAP